MIKLDAIANLILESLRPDSYDSEEEKKLKEKDDIWKERIIIIYRRREINGIHRS